jgi:CDP-paratose 2-epimerase
VVDTLLRWGSQHNLAWLRNQRVPGRFSFVQADVRDLEAMCRAAKDAEIIYHFAAQVAVTSSVEDPRTDFECNALGTFNMLEAARRDGRRPLANRYPGSICIRAAWRAAAC